MPTTGVTVLSGCMRAALDIEHFASADAPADREVVDGAGAQKDGREEQALGKPAVLKSRPEPGAAEEDPDLEGRRQSVLRPGRPGFTSTASCGTGGAARRHKAVVRSHRSGMSATAATNPLKRGASSKADTRRVTER
jgi:hypothetical protein